MSTIDAKTVWPGWETVRVLGRGSFGAVYEIERDVLGEKEKAALKVVTIPQNESEIAQLHAEGFDDESITGRFESYLQDIVREYSMMAKMKGCANIVYCDDVRYVQHDEGPGWDIYIKMELLTPLLEAMGKNAPEEQVAKLGRDLSNALAFCSARNVLHRDIKPQNIFVSSDGTYKLGDFGVAKISERTVSSGTKTGTYKYMAPEVYNNQPYGRQADEYSLGMVLYWLLNERRTPFLPLPPVSPTVSEEEAALRRRFGGEALPPPAHGSAALKRIVLKACAYDPKDRWQNAEELLRALQALEPETVPEPDEAPPPDKNSERTASVFGRSAEGKGSEEKKQAVPAATDAPEEKTVSVFSRPIGEATGTKPPAAPSPEADERTVMEFASRSQEPEPRATEAKPAEAKPAKAPNNEPGALASGQGAGKKKGKAWLWVAAACVCLLLLVVVINGSRRTEVFSKAAPEAPMDETPEPTPMPTVNALEIRYKWDDKKKDDIILEIGEELPLYAAIMPDDINGTVNWRIDDVGKDAFEIIVGEDNHITVKCLGRMPDGCGGVYLYAEVDGQTARCMLHVNSDSGWRFDENTGILYVYNDAAMESQSWKEDKESITRVVLSEGVTSIGDYAFSSCSSLTSIDIPEGVTSIGKEAFYDCYSLTSIDIPDSVTSIGDYAFEGCSSLRSIDIPNSVTSIGEAAFYGCHSLKSIDIPDSVTSIDKWAFDRCYSLTSINIPDSVTIIGRAAFYGCHSLTSIDIPDSVTSIGEWAFAACSGLTSIALPDSVTSIGDYAFDGCSSQTHIYYAGSKENWLRIEGVDGVPSNITVHYNAG